MFGINPYGFTLALMMILVGSTAGANPHHHEHAAQQIQQRVEAQQKQFEKAAADIVNRSQQRLQSERFQQFKAFAQQRQQRLLTDPPAFSPSPATQQPTSRIDQLLARYSQPLASSDNPRQPLNSLLIFVSQSLPTKSLNALAQQASRAGGTLVLRGLIDNDFKKTLLFVKGLLAKTGDQGGVIIDPTLYQLFDVNQIPTFITLGGALKPCATATCPRQIPPHDRLRGNVTLPFALAYLAEHGKHSAHVANSHYQQLTE